MSQQSVEQYVRLDGSRRNGARVVALGAGAPGSALFSGVEGCLVEEPWALHLSFSDEQRKNLLEMSTYTRGRKKAAGRRRALRGRKDSLLVWTPDEGRERYLKLSGRIPITCEAIGDAFPVRLRDYQARYQPGESGHSLFVYVAGCGRSGTTLLQRLMRSFEDAYVAPGERPFTSFLDLADRPERSLIVKRDALAWETLDAIPSGIKVIYCVRHPFDVLTSFHPGAKHDNFYIKPNRWRAEYLALKRTSECRQMLIVRYEDLIVDPDGTQSRISAFTGLMPGKRFSATKEKLSTESMGKWRDKPLFVEHLEKVARSEGSVLEEFMDRFGYAP
jgi:hypothetical protein